ncbi:HNH endonuclease signature motif containing protein [uncultured Actinobaculum sp.]|uniref:HNH endonuclease signature motif containing protein n=1 Tax=Actinobaculum massiliense TaxID=202789 RepID=UPI0035A5ED2C
MSRDGGCVFPGCTDTYQTCDVHHAQEWSEGGSTDINNGIALLASPPLRPHQAHSNSRSPQRSSLRKRRGRGEWSAYLARARDRAGVAQRASPSASTAGLSA